ncbi:MAG: HEAT repeat domain-containing protein, partial [Planctomycetota bacterium]|nr:HEAT repeat domain-containing protein [Planctomycetota bacterium]
VLVIITILIALGLGGIVVFHDGQAPYAKKPSKQSPKSSLRSLDGPRIGTGDTNVGTDRMSTRESLEYRLRLYATSGTLQQGRIVHSIRTGIQEYERPLLQILEEEPRGLIMPAIEIAGRLENEGPLSPLYSLVESADPRVRSRAIEAISNRRMWERISLRQLLQSEQNPDVLTAALRAASLVEDAPLSGMLPLLAHEEWRVVRAAQSAMPNHMGMKSLTLVDEFIETAPVGPAIAAIQVLGGLDPTEQRNKSVLKHLSNTSWAVQSASLKVLILSGGKIDDAEPIWAVIEGPATKVRMRVLAFLALEKTRSIDDPRFLKITSRLHPVAQLAAARGLIVNKNREGILILINLLSTKTGPAVTADDQVCAIQCAHEILQEVAQRVIEPRSELWLPWYRKNEALPGTPLEAVPRLAW